MEEPLSRAGTNVTKKNESPKEEVIKMKWSKINHTTQDIAAQFLGLRPNGTKKWCTSKILTVLHEKKNASNKTLFRDLRKKAHKLVRRDENAYWSKMATDLEDVTVISETRKQYMLLGEMNLKKKRNTNAENVKRSDGTVITG